MQEIIARAEAVYKERLEAENARAVEGGSQEAAAILREKLDEFAKPITLEMGKLFREAQAEVTLSEAHVA